MEAKALGEFKKRLLIVLLNVMVVFLALPVPCNGEKKESLRAAESETPPPGNDKKKPQKPVRDHPAFKERIKDREKMVKKQIHRRGVNDPNVLSALMTVPRHAFVRKGDSRYAYNNSPLPIGYGQTISQPYIVGFMTERLELNENFKVLEIGTGSGYQAAVCGEIVREVYTIEIIKPLAESAGKRLKYLGYRNIFVKAADGYGGWPDQAPFDAIIVTAAAGLVPPPLLKQLKPGGKMVLPLGNPYGFQVLVLVTKDNKGQITSKELLPVRFVPMVGKIMKKRY